MWISESGRPLQLARYPVRIQIPLATLFAASLVLGCEDDPKPGIDVEIGVPADVVADTPDESDAGAGDVLPDAPDPGPAPNGTQLLFDAAAAVNPTDETWYDFPFPSDLRMDADGTLAIGSIPNPLSQQLFAGLVEGADQLTGASMVPVAWFRFDGEIAASSPDDVIPPTPNARALLVNIDADSSRYGELAPVVAKALEEDDYVPSNVLAVGPMPGWVLDPSTRYAIVVNRSWGDSSGIPLGVPDSLWRVTAGASSSNESLDQLYAPLRPALLDAGVDPSEVAAATVFTTGDPVTDLFEMSEVVRERYTPTIENLAIDADDGAVHERFCELHGTLNVPEFQEGIPPFNTGGLFVFGEDGVPVEQTSTDIPVVISLPLGEMPAGGFPLVMYFHGSGGLSTQVVDRGEDWAPRLGPSHVLAGHGIGTAGSAHPVNPERLDPLPSSGFDYLNIGNLKAFRDTFRQGVFEQRLYLDALLDLRVSPAVVADCEGLSLPAEQDSYFFSPAPVMAMGQSMGGMFTNLMAPVEPRIEAIVPTGAGGFWSHFILETTLIAGAGDLIAAILQVDDLTHMHPTLHALQLAWEPVEAFVYVPRLAAEPLPGHPARSIYQPIGEQDSYFPSLTFDRITLAYRNQQAGEVVWPETQSVLEHRGLDGMLEYPIANNRVSLNGESYTGVAVQWAFDGVHDGHEVFQHFDDVKHQYGCFFETFYATGTGVVPAPAELGSACASAD